jgi:hypothetical protein
MKIIFENLRNFIFLFFCFNLVIISVHYFYDRERKFYFFQQDLPVYLEYDWSEEYFSDLNLEYDYVSFVSFKSKPFSSRTLNIDKNGIRISRNYNENGNVLFLGASNIFGFGSNDQNTIPSLFAKKTKDSLTTKNLADNGFTVFQSYIALSQHLILNNRPKYVICLNGALERTFLESRMAHTYEEQFKTAIELAGTKKRYDFKSYLIETARPLTSFTIWLKNKISRTDNAYSGNPEINVKEIEQTALRTVETWIKMYELCLANNIKFYCFYPPLMSYKSSDYSNSLIQKGLDKQIFNFRLDVYTETLRLLKQEKYSRIAKRFVNLGTILDEKEGNFIDWGSHISPKGNDIVANAIIENIFNKRIKKQ